MKKEIFHFFIHENKQNKQLHKNFDTNFRIREEKN
jgi:hypothetical protein